MSTPASPAPDPAPGQTPGQTPGQAHGPARPALTWRLALRLMGPFSLGYFLSYLYRAVNAVIAPDLVAELGLDAGALGLLTAAYFLTFAAFQLPLGILLDRFGPRRVESALLLFAALGAGLFALAEGESGLIVARALVGFGVSACMMAAFKAYVMWFPREKLTLVNGIHLAAGGLGALMATAPVEAALGVTGWRGVFWGLAGVTLFASALIFFAAPERDAGARHATWRDALGGVAGIYQSAAFWRIAPWAVVSQSTFMAVQTLWAGPWLTDVAGLTRPAAALVLLWTAAAMTAGFLIWGALAERLGRLFRVPPASVGAAGMALFLGAQALIAGGWAAAWEARAPGAALAVWMAFGFCGTAGVLTYAALSQAFPAHLAGRVNTSLNVLVFGSTFASQWAVGAIIDLWPRTPHGGYAPQGFEAALWALIALQMAAWIWYAVRRRIRI